MQAGTVSKILWHFTGGPKWDAENRIQSNEPKEIEIAYDNLCKILESKRLKLSNYNEEVNYTIPEIEVIDMNREEPYSLEKNYKMPLGTVKVCCVADIPISHLDYHAERYGKIAIGFYREAIIEGNFHPVIYSLVNNELPAEIVEIYHALSLSEVYLKEIGCKYNEMVEELLLEASGNEKYLKGFSTFLNIFLNSVKDYNKKSYSNVMKILALLKTFNREEFDTIYCEREWRSICEFNFDFDDIAMIIIPKCEETNYFDKFINVDSKKVELAESIPIIPWEDLIEH